MLATFTATFSFSARGGFWWAVAILLGLAAIGLTLQGYRRQGLAPEWRGLCLGLKIVALLLLALILLEPVETGKQPKPGSNDFLVLVDNGESMQLHGAEALRRELSEAQGAEESWWGRLESRFRLEAFAFDQRLHKLRGTAGLDFAGRRSDLGASLEALQQRYARRPLAGVLLLTDGNATDRDRLAALTLERPVFPVLIGDPGATRRDLSLTHLAVSSSSFEDAPVTVALDVRAEGLNGETCTVRILDGEGEEVARETRGIDSNERQDFSLRLRFRTPKAGVQAYRAEVALDSAAGESEKRAEITNRNNVRDFVVDLGRGGYRVLYIGGRPNWDYKFLRRALQRDEEVQLVGLVRVAKREPKFEWRGRAGETSNPLFRGFQNRLPEEEGGFDKPVLIRLNTRDAEELRDGFPKERESLFGEYDAVILDDVEAGFFTADQQELLEKFVSLRGGALLMLGGRESLQLGGYDRTPIARMLPVYPESFGAAQPSEMALFDLTREGWLEPWVRLRLTEREEEIRLAHMPAFSAVNRLRAVKPGASVVATVTDQAGDEYPAFAIQAYGEGRAGALMLGDVWRWGMEDPEHREDMEKWWRQVVRWLVADVPDFIEVRSDWTGEPGGATRRIEVRVRNPAFPPEENATVELLVSAAGPAETEEGREPARIFAEPSLEEAGLFTAEFPCHEPGAYQVEAIVQDAGGNDLGTASGGWAWTPEEDEFASLLPDRAVLEDLAERSGGRVVARGELAGFVRDLAKMEVPVTEVWSRPAWHRPGWLALVMGLFLLEWGIRRWKGLA